MQDGNIASLYQASRSNQIARPKSRPYRSNRRTVFPELHKYVSPLKIPKPLTSLTELLAISHIQHNRTRRIVDSYMNDHTALRILPVRDIVVVASSAANKASKGILKGPAVMPVAETPKVSKSKSVRPYRKFNSEVMVEEDPAISNNNMRESFTEGCSDAELPQKRASSNLNHKLPTRGLFDREEKWEKYQKFEKCEISRSVKLPTCYYYSIPNGGNNEQLVRQILSMRPHWKALQKPHQASFKWLPSIQNFKFKKLESHGGRIINHFQRHHEITTKNNLIRNLQIYCESRQIEVFSVTPVTFVIDFDDEYCEYNVRQFLSFFMQNQPKKTPEKEEAGHHPTANPNKGVVSDFLKEFVPYMAWQGSEVRRQVNPLSKPTLSSCYGDSYIWLLKPTGLNRGRGIEIFNSIERLKQILLGYMAMNKRRKFQAKPKKPQVKTITMSSDSDSDEPCYEQPEHHLSAQLPSTNPNPESPHQNTNNHRHQSFSLVTCSFVLQKYIQKPLLINERKFDIRVWALLRQDMSCYFFREGYLRLSSEKYSLDISNYFVHLTNNAVQQHCEKYGSFESGNQLSFAYFRNLVDDGLWQSPNNPSTVVPPPSYDLIVSRMKELVYMSLSSVRTKVNPHRRKHCFEIFGYDFILDSSLKVWLIEVNTNPCIETSSPLLKTLIPRMLNDAMKLTVDEVFGRGHGENRGNLLTQSQVQPSSAQQLGVFPVAGYPDNENMWECLGKLAPNAEYKKKQQTH